jgi:hypothetical protein
MYKRLHIASAVFTVISIAGAMLLVTAGSRTVYICPHCAAHQTRWRYLGFAGQGEESNEFTEWYVAHRPAHTHAWQRASCTRSYSITGTTTMWACGEVHPLCLIPPELLVEFAEHADEETLDAYFREVASEDEELRERAVKRIWNTIQQTDVAKSP